jgi:hypothetical protein
MLLDFSAKVSKEDIVGTSHSKYRGPEKGRFSPDVETSHNRYVGPEKGRLFVSCHRNSNASSSQSALVVGSYNTHWLASFVPRLPPHGYKYSAHRQPSSRILELTQASKQPARQRNTDHRTLIGDPDSERNKTTLVKPYW